MALLQIEQLGKRYGNSDSWALRDFSLEVANGELVAIVGPSGCGKSTLLRMIAGLEEESEGTIRLGGRDLLNLAPKDRDLALMFQSYTLLPHLTVEANLAYGLKLRGVPRTERLRKAREAAELLGITPLLARLPSEISGGERQRAALGRAVLRDPAAFLFDEPLSSLDALMRLQLRVEIQRLHQRVRVPMLFVTHDQGEALTLGDRVLVLNRGRIQQVAPPDELYRHPANAFVASFIGAPGMNLFQGRIESENDSTRFMSPALSFALPLDLAGKLKDHHEITLGIRPEHFHRASAEAASLHGTITAVERQGGLATLYLQNGDVSFAAKAGEDFSARHGDPTAWTFDTTHIHWFDYQSGNSLLV